MRHITFTMLFCLLLPSLVTAETKFIVLNEREPRAVLIPFADEVPEWFVDYVREGLNKPSVPEHSSTNGRTLSITLGHDPMPDYLVKYQNCPQWVANYYAKDPRLLARISKGYELQSMQKEWTPDEFRKNWIEKRSGVAMTLNDQQMARMKKYYAFRHREYGKYKMMKVVEPQKDE